MQMMTTNDELDECWRRCFDVSPLQCWQYGGCWWGWMTSWVNEEDVLTLCRSDPTITSGPSCPGDLSESLQPFGTGINCLRWGFLIIVRRRRSFRWQEYASSHQLRSLKNYIADFKCAPIFWMIGWFLFQVNGIPLKGLYHEEVVGVLKEVSSQIFFLITVTLTKKKEVRHKIFPITH